MERPYGEPPLPLGCINENAVAALRSADRGDSGVMSPRVPSNSSTASHVRSAVCRIHHRLTSWLCLASFFLPVGFSLTMTFIHLHTFPRQHPRLCHTNQPPRHLSISPSNLRQSLRQLRHRLGPQYNDRRTRWRPAKRLHQTQKSRFHVSKSSLGN